MRTERTKILSLLLSAVLLLASAPLTAAAAKNVNKTAITITKTDIQADDVFNTNGYASLTRLGEYNPACGYLYPYAALADRNGKLLFPYRQTRFNYFYGNGIVSLVESSPTFGAYRSYTDQTETLEKARFYRLDGTEAFPSDYDGATPMLEGYAFAVSGINNKENEPVACYLINADGNRVYTFSGGFTKKTSIWGVWNDISIQTASMANTYQDGLLMCKSGSDGSGWPEKIWFINEQGETVLTLPAEYKYSKCAFSEGLAVVQSDWKTGHAGFIDKTGNVVIPLEFDQCEEFHNGLAAVSKGRQWGYIDKTGKTVIPFEYDDACGAGDGLASVAKDNKYGLVDYENNVVVPLEYDIISSFDEGVAYAIKDGTLYIITDYRQEISGSVKASELPADKTISLTGDTVLTLDADKTTDAILLNGHALTIEGDATLACTIGGPLGSGEFNNGSLTINSGTVRSLSINLGDGELNVCGGLFNFAAADNDENERMRLVAQALNVKDGEVRLEGGYVQFAQVNVSGGSLIVGENDKQLIQNYYLRAGFLNVSGGEARIRDRINVSIINVSGGVLDVENDDYGAVAGSINVSGGKLRGVGAASGINDFDGMAHCADEEWNWIEEDGEYSIGLYITGGEVEAISTNGGYGCYMPTISVTGGKLTASGDFSALESHNKIIVGEGMRVSKPEGGYATDEITLEWETNGFKRSWTGYVIFNADGTTAAETVIEPVASGIDAENAKELDLTLFTAPGVTAADLLALAGNGATVTKADGSAPAGTEKIGSGMTLTKPDGTKLTVVLKGDNDGDGEVSAADARLALRQAVGLENFNDWQTAATLVGEGKEITAAEARLILRAAVGLEILALV